MKADSKKNGKTECKETGGCTCTEDTIRHRAYFLWEQAGKPAGKSHDFWVKAEAELKAKS